MDLSYAMLEKHIADPKELPDNTDAVSYTHLDVYKRQVSKYGIAFLVYAITPLYIQ